MLSEVPYTPASPPSPDSLPGRAYPVGKGNAAIRLTMVRACSGDISHALQLSNRWVCF
jgi:hypothetical protein